MCFSEACLTSLLARAGFVTTATIRSTELDAALTDGQPLRLRLIATRSRNPGAPAPAPLDAAIEALSQFARRRSPLASRARGILPVRLRAALLNRSRERDRTRREA